MPQAQLQQVYFLFPTQNRTFSTINGAAIPTPLFTKAGTPFASHQVNTYYAPRTALIGYPLVLSPPFLTTVTVYYTANQRFVSMSTH